MVTVEKAVDEDAVKDLPAAEGSEQEEGDEVEPEIADDLSAKEMNTFERAKDVEFDGTRVDPG